MSNDPSSVRRILPQNPQHAQGSQMGSFSSFAPQQFPQRETQKNYVFVDEHNRHKRLKVMRACEGCRRRKIKCDAATTNTWPCSACIRLKLHCVKPNGFDADPNAYETMDPIQFQQMSMQQQVMHTPPKDQYGQGYDPNAAYQMPFDASQQVGMSYTGANMGEPYAGQNVFPTPPMQPGVKPDDSSPEAYSPDSYKQQDLADLLGTLKVDETGAAPYLRNKASFRREEAPAAVEDDDEFDNLPPVKTAPGLKIRIPPELMPDPQTVLHYFDLYFTHVHPFVPVLNKALFMKQWNTSREAISPLILEAIFAMGGRLAEDPGDGQQWLALASRHADAFMDIPRLSTLQALLMIMKAREAAPKRGYYYRSWMTVVQCVQISKDLGLDEHYEEHLAGRRCDHNPVECQLRTRIWQIVFVCEAMVGTPQGRHDLAVKMDTVDYSVPRPINGPDDQEFQVSRNFTYFARVTRNVANLSSAYARLKKKKKEWAIDPELQTLNLEFSQFLDEVPPDLVVSFPSDNTPPWLPSPFVGNMYSYYYLSLILLHRPQLSFLDPSEGDGLWKHHMVICYNSAKALCRLQEAIVNDFGLIGLQCAQRGFSFTVYAGLSCIVLHLVAIVSPDPELNADARQFFTRHMRIMEKVMDNWHMPELQKQIDAVREAFSADVRKPFNLKPSFPYGSPNPSSHSSPPRLPQGYRPALDTTSPLDQHLDAGVGFSGQTISPPISAGPSDGKNHSPSIQSIVMMQGTQSQGMRSNMSLADQPAWNPARIFEQWNTTFGTAAHTDPASDPSLNFPTPPGAPEVSTLQDIQAVQAALPTGSQHQLSPQQFSAAPASSFVTPAMWRESVASVYEGGLKRSWDYDGGHR